MLLGFHPFGHDINTEVAGHVDDGFDDFPVSFAFHRVGYEGSVDFQGVDWKPFQVTQRGVPGAEIVYGKSDSFGPQAFHLGNAYFRVFHHAVFGDLQLQGGWRQAAFIDDIDHHFYKISLLNLPGREIYRYEKVQKTHVVPAFGLDAGGPQHPLSHRNNDAGLFGDPDKFSRENQPPFRVVPSEQGLHAHYAVGLIGQRLVVKHQLIAVQGFFQIAFHLHAVQGLSVHLFGKEPIPIPTVVLGGVHGHVRIFHQAFHVPPVIGKYADTDAHSGKYLVGVRSDGTGNGVQDFAGHAGHIDITTQVSENNRKLVSVEPEQVVRFPETSFKPAGHFFEQLIADIVAQGVVDLFKFIQIQEHQCPDTI